MHRTSFQWGCLVSFWCILTLWTRLGAELANSAITYQKCLFHYAVILPTLLHSQSCNLGGSEKEKGGRNLLLESRKPHLKLWATGWAQKGTLDLWATVLDSTCTVTSIEPRGVVGFCTGTAPSFRVTSQTLISGVPDSFPNAVSGIGTQLPSCKLSSLSRWATCYFSSMPQYE